MKSTEINIRHYFEPLLQTRAWKAKLGHGSFVTFEFGRRVKVNGHFHGEWHLWIYLAQWALLHGNRKLASSDSDRTVISVAIQRLEKVPLTEVRFAPEQATSTFVFDDFRLVVSPADYLEDADDRDVYWMLFMPNREVLSVGPGGVQVERSDATHYA